MKFTAWLLYKSSSSVFLYFLNELRHPAGQGKRGGVSGWNTSRGHPERRVLVRTTWYPVRTVEAAVTGRQQVSEGQAWGGSFRSTQGRAWRWGGGHSEKSGHSEMQSRGGRMGPAWRTCWKRSALGWWSLELGFNKGRRSWWWQGLAFTDKQSGCRAWPLCEGTEWRSKVLCLREGGKTGLHAFRKKEAMGEDRKNSVMKKTEREEALKVVLNIWARRNTWERKCFLFNGYSWLETFLNLSAYTHKLLQFYHKTLPFLPF